MEKQKLLKCEKQEDLTNSIGKMLKAQSKKVAVAESCTGGLISHLFTKNPGSSLYYLGGVTAYANELKTNILGVSAHTLTKYGAVSEQTVREMLRGVLVLCGADVGISTSGIAGPGGGTKDKPVGTIWIAVGNKMDIRTKMIQLMHDRWTNNECTAHTALNMLRLFLLETEKESGKGQF